ncbi:LuxR C-terminal-related transcriptional regulator [Streptomyces sp. NPDC085614]|uniref:LuxR C-terminal-related transcriptional regulator n=1 Tax=Streptomyces sp. NPDC085614 TaxID=3365733 RepID=UPI0037D7A1E2
MGREEDLAAIRNLLAGSKSAGVLLAGVPGVGKTRLLKEAVDALSSKYAVTWFHGAPSVPAKAAMAEAPSREASPQAVRTSSSRNNKQLLVVDDAHLLDAADASSILALARQRRTQLLLTVSASSEVEPAITTLWKEEHVARIEVSSLGLHAMRQLASAFLQDALDYDGSLRLAHMADGNPLLLRELVQAALAEETLHFSHGRWHLAAGTPTSPALHDLCRAEIDRLSPVEHRALELIAVAEPVSLAVMERLTSQPSLVALEARRLIVACDTASEDSGNPHGREHTARVHLRISSPLIGHLVRQCLPPLRRRQHLQDLLRHLPQAQSGHPSALRNLNWRLDSGENPPEHDLVEAAHHACVAHDLRSAARFSGAAWHHHRSLEAATLHISASMTLGLFTHAAELIDAARASHPGTAAHELDCVQVLGLLLKGDTDGAERLAHQRLESTERTLCLAMTAYFRGEFSKALDMCEALLQRNDQAGWREAAVFSMAALCRTGRPVDALALHERIAAHAGSRHATAPFCEALLQEAHAAALHGAGRSLEALQLLEERYEQVALAHGRVPGARWETALAMLLLECGRPRQALSVLSSAPGREQEAAPWERTARIYQMLASACLPDTAPACATEDESLPALDPSDQLLHQLIVCAHRALSRGDHAAAGELLTQAAESALAQGHAGDVAVVVHEMARVGLARLAEPYCDISVQGPLLAARADYARALARKDSSLLRRAAQAFADMGCRLYAAEGFAELSRMQRKAGHGRDATSALVKARELALNCEGATTPALHTLDAVEPLTTREREIALMAGRGMSDRDIADQLAVSSRTVSNHLYRIYMKLGLSGRRELRLQAVTQTDGRSSATSFPSAPERHESSRSGGPY